MNKRIQLKRIGTIIMAALLIALIGVVCWSVAQSRGVPPDTGQSWTKGLWPALQNLGITTLVVAAAAYVLRGVFNRWLSLGLERHKAGLNAQHAIALERLRGDLQLAATEHQIRFSKTHERRDEVIAEVYKLLFRARVPFQSLADSVEFHGEPSKEEKFKVAVDAFNNLSTCFYENRLYLEEGLCRQIEQFLERLKRVHLLWTRILSGRGVPPNGDGIDNWDKSDKVMREAVPPILRNIEASFREILGIPNTVPAEAPAPRSN